MFYLSVYWEIQIEINHTRSDATVITRYDSGDSAWCGLASQNMTSPDD